MLQSAQISVIAWQRASETKMGSASVSIKNFLYLLLLMRGNWIFIDFDDCHLSACEENTHTRRRSNEDIESK
jgi:hypothetical protein